MTTFTTFTTAHKQQIAYARARINTERPTMNEYGTVQHALGLRDFVIYAALRGADYRKGDHTGGVEATAVLRQVIRDIVYWGTSTGRYGELVRSKLIPNGHGTDELMELKQVLEFQLEKWSAA